MKNDEILFFSQSKSKKMSLEALPLSNKNMMIAILNEYGAEKALCNNKARFGQIRSFIALTNCYDSNLKNIFERHHYQYMDKLELFKNRHLEIAQKLDDKKISFQESDDQYLSDILELFAQ